MPLHRPCDHLKDFHPPDCDHRGFHLFSNCILNRTLSVVACHVCGSPPINSTWYRQDEGAHCCNRDRENPFITEQCSRRRLWILCVARNAANIQAKCVFISTNVSCALNTHNTIQYNITHAWLVRLNLFAGHHDCTPYAIVPYPGGHGHHETPGPGMWTYSHDWLRDFQNCSGIFWFV